MTKARGYAAHDAKTPLAPFSFERREPRGEDVEIEILYCGICHTDIHQTRADWHGAMYPMVPGHEIVGRVTRVGADVKKFKVGDIAGVGVYVDSCRQCCACKADLEQYCEHGGTSWTYNSKARGSDEVNMGGYSDHIVAAERYAVKIPSHMDLKAVAPLLCAGITTYSPLRHHKVGPGMRVGIVGLGGLGHMGVKFAHALGAHTVMITTSPDKAADAKRLGADEVLLSRDADAMARQAESFDFLLDTIPVSHDLNPYVALLKRDSTLVLVGALMEMEPPLLGNNLMSHRRTLAGSNVGGMKEIQEMIDFCTAKKIVSDVEMVSMGSVNETFERLLKSDVKYRFVIDMATLKGAA